MTSAAYKRHQKMHAYAWLTGLEISCAKAML